MLQSLPSQELFSPRMSKWIVSIESFLINKHRTYIIRSFADLSCVVHSMNSRCQLETSTLTTSQLDPLWASNLSAVAECLVSFFFLNCDSSAIEILPSTVKKFSLLNNNFGLI